MANIPLIRPYFLGGWHGKVVACDPTYLLVACDPTYLVG